MNPIGHWHPENMRQRLRERWENNPGKTLFDTAAAMGLGSVDAERLVVKLVSDGIVRYEGNPFRAVFV